MKNILIIALSVLLISISLWVIIEINQSTDKYIYGNSYRQNKIVNTIRLHKYGITGKGITIGLIDAGCYTKHPAFSKTNIVKEFDFVTNTPNVSDQKHNKGIDHGTSVFSVVGGYKVNELIGIAFAADFILAKTDITTDRLAEEELNAVKASRWLKNNGANIISTSLSFNKFDNADYYFSDQMDGKKALITRNADSLIAEGILYFCSAGNNFAEDWHIIEPPGDGFSVISVGSVDKNGIHSYFSSCGPTTDGRIKPDIAAPGENVWNANYYPKLKPEFGWNHGTSLAAPIAAGIAALVLSAHPELSPQQIAEAIKSTSSKSNSPDNIYGWGIPDAEKAVTYFGPAFSNTPKFILLDKILEIQSHVFSSYGLDKSNIKVHLTTNINDKASSYKLNEIDDNYFACSIDLEPTINKLYIYFTASDIHGKSTMFPSGVIGEYFVYDLNKQEMTMSKQKL